MAAGYGSGYKGSIVTSRAVATFRCGRRRQAMLQQALARHPVARVIKSVWLTTSSLHYTPSGAIVSTLSTQRLLQCLVQ
jgi:hypothetical protein